MGLEERFPWFNEFKKKAWETFPNASEDTLELLIDKMNEEFENLNWKRKYRSKAFFTTLCDLYMHFSWKMKWNEDPAFQSVCVHTLYFMTHAGVVLSRGGTKERWLQKILCAFSAYPGDQSDVLDPILLIKDLKKEDIPGYREILRLTLANMGQPQTAVSFIKTMLLFRRLNSISTLQEKTDLLKMVHDIQCPPGGGDFLNCDRPAEILKMKISRRVLNKLLTMIFKNKYGKIIDVSRPKRNNCNKRRKTERKAKGLTVCSNENRKIKNKQSFAISSVRSLPDKLLASPRKGDSKETPPFRSSRPPSVDLSVSCHPLSSDTEKENAQAEELDLRESNSETESFFIPINGNGVPNAPLMDDTEGCSGELMCQTEHEVDLSSRKFTEAFRGECASDTLQGISAKSSKEDEPYSEDSAISPGDPHRARNNSSQLIQDIENSSKCSKKDKFRRFILESSSDTDGGEEISKNKTAQGLVSDSSSDLSDGEGVARNKTGEIKCLPKEFISRSIDVLRDGEDPLEDENIKKKSATAASLSTYVINSISERESFGSSLELEPVHPTEDGKANSENSNQSVHLKKIERKYTNLQEDEKSPKHTKYKAMNNNKRETLESNNDSSDDSCHSVTDLSSDKQVTLRNSNDCRTAHRKRKRSCRLISSSDSDDISQNSSEDLISSSNVNPECQSKKKLMKLQKSKKVLKPDIGLSTSPVTLSNELGQHIRSSPYVSSVTSNAADQPSVILDKSCLFNSESSFYSNANSPSETQRFEKNAVKQCRVILYDSLADHATVKLHLEKGCENQIVLPENIRQYLNGSSPEKLLSMCSPNRMEICGDSFSDIGYSGPEIQEANIIEMDKSGSIDSDYSPMKNAASPKNISPKSSRRKRITVLDSNSDVSDATPAKNLSNNPESNSSRRSRNSVCSSQHSGEVNSSFERSRSNCLLELSASEHNSSKSTSTGSSTPVKARCKKPPLDSSSDTLNGSCQKMDPKLFIEFSASEEDPVSEDDSCGEEMASGLDSFIVPDDYVSGSESSGNESNGENVSKNNSLDSPSNSSPRAKKKFRRSRKLTSESESEEADVDGLKENSRLVSVNAKISRGSTVSKCKLKRTPAKSEARQVELNPGSDLNSNPDRFHGCTQKQTRSNEDHILASEISLKRTVTSISVRCQENFKQSSMDVLSEEPLLRSSRRLTSESVSEEADVDSLKEDSRLVFADAKISRGSTLSKPNSASKLAHVKYRKAVGSNLEEDVSKDCTPSIKTVCLAELGTKNSFTESECTAENKILKNHYSAVCGEVNKSSHSIFASAHPKVNLPLNEKNSDEVQIPSHALTINAVAESNSHSSEINLENEFSKKCSTPKKNSKSNPRLFSVSDFDNLVCFNLQDSSADKIKQTFHDVDSSLDSTSPVPLFDKVVNNDCVRAGENSKSVVLCSPQKKLSIGSRRRKRPPKKMSETISHQTQINAILFSARHGSKTRSSEELSEPLDSCSTLCKKNSNSNSEQLLRRIKVGGKNSTKVCSSDGSRSFLKSEERILSDFGKVVDPPERAFTNRETIPGMSQYVDSNKDHEEPPSQLCDERLVQSIIDKLEKDTHSLTTLSVLKNFSDGHTSTTAVHPSPTHQNPKCVSIHFDPISAIKDNLATTSNGMGSGIGAAVPRYPFIRLHRCDDKIKSDCEGREAEFASKTSEEKWHASSELSDAEKSPRCATSTVLQNHCTGYALRSRKKIQRCCASCRD